jgi:hypothetical protein
MALVIVTVYPARALGSRLGSRIYPRGDRMPSYPRKAKTVKPWTLPLVVAAAILAVPVLTADAPYAGQQARPIKALSDDDIAALSRGEGMGMAKAAELNSYPGPAHVLQLAGRLGLTDTQRRDVQAIFDRMSAAAKPLGSELIAQELALDQLFATGNITPDRLVAATATIAELQGRLRAVHLSAHLETRTLLSADQIGRYEQVRGYTNPQMPGQHHHHHG